MVPFLVPDRIMARFQDRFRQEENVGERLRDLCALYRINTLAGLLAARHGWLGASFSAMEILAVVYHGYIREPLLPLDRRNTLCLSKGHAAMAQYAILAGLGAFSTRRLLEYKAVDGLPAHCDRSIPGVDTDSGSLGQGLSKAIGLAIATRRRNSPHRQFALLGDGELQEGQVFESLLTLRRLGLSHCLPIIDRNGLQSESATGDIKDAADWPGLLTGIGLRVLTVPGHDGNALAKAIDEAFRGETPAVLIAETTKGFGTHLTAMPRNLAPRQGVWHGRIPTDEEYSALVRELADSLHDGELGETVALHFRRESLPEPFDPTTAWHRRERGMGPWSAATAAPSPRPSPPAGARENLGATGSGEREWKGAAHASEREMDGALHGVARGTGRERGTGGARGTEGGPLGALCDGERAWEESSALSTGEAFGQALTDAGKRFPDLFVLDADLEKACRLGSFAATYPDRFIEVGISEQDLVSIATGIALGKGIPVVNTYAAFFKRAIDQLAVCGAEKVPLIVAGHYAGLDYFTDGKSHQTLNDVALIRALGTYDLFEPLTAEETTQVVSHLLHRMQGEAMTGRPSRPAYVRLHRTPVPGLPPLPSAFVPGRPALFPATGETGLDRLWRLFVAGPRMLELGLAVQKALRTLGRQADVVGISSYQDPTGLLRHLLHSCRRAISLESHSSTGGLGDFLAGISGRRPLTLGAERQTGSTRTEGEMMALHHLTMEEILARILLYAENP